MNDYDLCREHRSPTMFNGKMDPDFERLRDAWEVLATPEDVPLQGSPLEP